ncbi:MAG: transposase [Actinobacteria bacterium]|nr:transposase [Actinomycetota bacterium]
MKRKRFTIKQIIKILKEAELGIKIVEICRKYGIAEQTFYNWRNKYGGMTINPGQLPTYKSLFPVLITQTTCNIT